MKSKKKLLTILGTRPEIIKMSSLIKYFDNFFYHKFILSGQHFSKDMTTSIIEDLKIRKPDQILSLKKKSEENFFSLQENILKTLKKYNPKILVYHGDTFTALASCLTAYYFFPKIIRVHIESGYRSNDPNSIEDKIRKQVDKLSNYNFAPRSEDKNQLKKEGIKKNIFVVGNTIIDTVDKFKIITNSKKITQDYIYCTIHRAETVDDKKKLKDIIYFLNRLSKKISIYLSIHPRTKKMLKKYNLKFNHSIKKLGPIKYSKNIFLLKNSLFCISDSGGLQEEAVILGKKCFIPGKTTPHHFYLKKNSNKLIDLSKKKTVNEISEIIKKKINVKKYYHKKNVSKKICQILLKIK